MAALVLVPSPVARGALRAFLLLISCGVSSGLAQTAQGPFEEYFRPLTMRVDYFHSGGMGQEILALDRVVSDGEWAGSLTRLVDDTNLGAYLFEVVDPDTDRVLYSRGFASIYGEWETTAEAGRSYRTFHESLRFPWPAGPVRVVLRKRAETGDFREIWSVPVDPDSRFVNPAATSRRGGSLERYGQRATHVEGGPGATGRGLHGGRDGQVPR